MTHDIFSQKTCGHLLLTAANASMIL